MSNPDPPQPASSAATIAAETPQPFPSLPTSRPLAPPWKAFSAACRADVAVSVDGGTATIEGSVPRGVDRDRITTALGQLAGVTEVRDRLRIRTA